MIWTAKWSDRPKLEALLILVQNYPSIDQKPPFTSIESFKNFNIFLLTNYTVAILMLDVFVIVIIQNGYICALCKYQGFWLRLSFIVQFNNWAIGSFAIRSKIQLRDTQPYFDCKSIVRPIAAHLCVDRRALRLPNNPAIIEPDNFFLGI